MQTWEKDVKINTMMNQGKTEIIILGNFIVHKDILKMLKLENPMIVQILSLAIFGQIQESKRIENAECTGCCSLLFTANLPLMKVGFLQYLPIQ